MAWISRMQGQAPLGRTPPARCMCSHTSSASTAPLTFPPGSPIGSCWLQWQSGAGHWSLWTSVNDACSREQREQWSGYCPQAQDVCHSVWEINDHTNQTLCVHFRRGNMGECWWMGGAHPSAFPHATPAEMNTELIIVWVWTGWSHWSGSRTARGRTWGTAEEVLSLVPLYPFALPFPSIVLLLSSSSPEKSALHKGADTFIHIKLKWLNKNQHAVLPKHLYFET